MSAFSFDWVDYFHLFAGQGILVRFSNIAQLLTLKCQRIQHFFSQAVQHRDTRFTNLELLLKCVKATFQIKAVARSLILRPLEVHRAVSATAAKNTQ